MKAATLPVTDVVEADLAKRGLWLVKVPRYLSEQWEANSGAVVGRLVVRGNDDVKFCSESGLVQSASSLALSSSQPGSGVPSPAGASTSSVGSPRLNAPAAGGFISIGKKPGQSSLAAAKAQLTVAAPAEIPSEHAFHLADVKDQSLAVLIEDKSELAEEADIRSGRLQISGRVVKRAECRPPATTSYMRLKRSQIERSGQPKKFVKTLDRTVHYKPVSVHVEDKMRQKQKKDGAKTVRADRDQMMQALFAAFEKHEYYRAVDLQNLTQQPPSFVKECLSEIAVYVTTPPHKNMWRLKKEYANYKAKASS